MQNSRSQYGHLFTNSLPPFFANDREEESEDILGEPAAPISSMYADNVRQPKKLRGPRDISRSPDDEPMQPGSKKLFNFPKSHGRQKVSLVRVLSI